MSSSSTKRVVVIISNNISNPFIIPEDIPVTQSNYHEQMKYFSVRNGFYKKT
jgi:hypothetical protein